MKFMLNEQELENHLTKEMVAPTEAQPLRDHTAYQKWNEKDRNARYTLLSSLQNDLIEQFDELPTCKVLWDQLKFSFGGTSTTRLRSLVIKFEEYTKDPKHTMSEHLRVMSNMIGKLRDAGHALTDEQQVRAVISIGDASKNLNLHELEEVEPTLPSPIEGGELVSRPVVAEDSVSDLQTSGSIPDSGSTPQGPLGQQDSQLRRVVRDSSKRLIGLSQETYIKKVIERFRMHNSKPIDTPMDKACTLTTDQCPKNDEEKNRMSKVPYAAAVGSLMYAMLCTRPNICYAVGLVSRYQSNLGPAHCDAVKRILRYLRGTADLVLCYHGGDLRLRGLGR
ncbi:hypothetical protein RJ640_028455 [Escallonia rubra]|uniref:Uncharacterized protein n=1 Tax=Escallonia rubra TaxID=112253 RepID=A0AA88U1G0_9ASTE|nr:hypothetical protein RJ640_028455 [Escallonia rubra]